LVYELYLEIGNCKIIAVAAVLFTVNVNGQLIVIVEVTTVEKSSGC
jgi:hypothetical protein